ncbi:MAG: hypothetical protein WAU70_14990 [Flavobacteriales bacterium]
MKSPMFLRVLTHFSLLSLATGVFAQGKIVDRRDQAEGWYLPVHGAVLADSKKADEVTVRLYKDNEQLPDVPVAKDGTFLAELDIDHSYTLLVMKPGYQNEMITVDTTLPEGLVEYPAYECTVNLDPANKYAGKEEGFFLDFPSAVVSYSAEQGGFYHNEHYMDHIKGKLAGYAQVSF